VRRNNAFERTVDERGFGHRWRAAAQRGRLELNSFFVFLAVLASPDRVEGKLGGSILERE
jgi:hypothetical protein